MYPKHPGVFFIAQLPVNIPRCQTGSFARLNPFKKLKHKHKLSCQRIVKQIITHQFWKAFETRPQMEVVPKTR